VNISALFIRRPIMTTLVMAAIIMFGVIASQFLPVSDLPNVDFPTIQVSATLPGASPETMASSVATPLERQFSTIAGLDSMTSSNTLGGTAITLQFNLSRNIDMAGQDVQAMIAKAARSLPPQMTIPPSYQKVNPADQPILFIALSSPVLPLSKVNDFADTMIAQRVSMVSGVAQVQIFGPQKYAVRIQLDPNLLASYGLGLDDVNTAVQTGNVNIPTGVIYGSKTQYTIHASGQLLNADSYKSLIVAYRNGRPVRLQDVGNVVDSVENDKIASWYKDTRAIVLAILRQPGTNTVEVVDNIKKLLPEFREHMPATVNMDILYDRSVSIRGSIKDIKFTMLLTMALVIMVIFLFLKNVSSTIIPSLALPMSIIGTFSVLYLFGYSIDNLSLMALTLSVGFVVDDAIVVLENIVRHMEKGESAMEASLNGSREIGFTVLSMTLSLVAVFIPIFLMGGVLGRLLHEFSVAICAAIITSGIVSLTLTPMICSRFLRHEGEEKHGRAYWVLENAFVKLRSWYERSLRFVLGHQRMVLILSMVVLVLTVFLFSRMPGGFLPTEDTGMIFAFTEARQGIGFDDMKEHQKKMADIVLKDSNVDAFMSGVGAGGPNSASNTGRMFMILKPLDQRTLSADEVIQELRPKFAQVPGIRAFMQVPPPIRIGGMLTKSAYQYTLQGPSTEELYKFSGMLEEKLRVVPIIQDVNSDMQLTNPQINIGIKRDVAASYGISPAQIENALFQAYGTYQASTIYAPDNQYQVIMELAPQFQRDPAALSMLYVRSSSGKLAPLSEVADIGVGVGPLQVNHLGQLPAVTISFNLKPGVSLSQAMDSINDIATKTIPESITTTFQGAAQAFQSSFKGMWLIILLAVLVIYIVLGILYESFVHPLTILSGLPSAGLGAVLTLMFFHKELNIYSLVGVIMLVGIVKKNAIMMIDFALEAQRKGGLDSVEAIFQGATIRFRPIMMTTMAALMGTLPIALGMGAGSESRRPLGLAVVGGLLFSQLITLYLTPVVYIYLDKFQKRKKPENQPA